MLMTGGKCDEKTFQTKHLKLAKKTFFLFMLFLGLLGLFIHIDFKIKNIMKLLKYFQDFFLNVRKYVMIWNF